MARPWRTPSAGCRTPTPGPGRRDRRWPRHSRSQRATTFRRSVLVEDRETDAIEARQTVQGRDPQVTVGGLVETADDILGQSVVHRPDSNSERGGGLQGKRSPQPDKQKN